MLQAWAPRQVQAKQKPCGHEFLSMLAEGPWEAWFVNRMGGMLCGQQAGRWKVQMMP